MSTSTTSSPSSVGTKMECPFGFKRSFGSMQKSRCTCPGVRNVARGAEAAAARDAAYIFRPFICVPVKSFWMFLFLQLHHQAAIRAVVAYIAQLRPARAGGGKWDVSHCTARTHLVIQRPDHMPAGNLIVAELVTVSRLPLATCVMVYGTRSSTSPMRRSMGILTSTFTSLGPRRGASCACLLEAISLAMRARTCLARQIQAPMMTHPAAMAMVPFLLLKKFMFIAMCSQGDMDGLG